MPPCRSRKLLLVLAAPLLALLGCVVVRPPGISQAVELPPAGHFTLWQLPVTPVPPRGEEDLTMSYVIQGPSGRLVVVDGGRELDADYLTTFLLARGGHVDDWFISHAHSDHVGALTRLLESSSVRGLRIDRIYASLVSERWLRHHDATEMLPSTRALKRALRASGKAVIRPTLGQKIVVDGMEFQVLQLADEKLFTNSNDQSMVIRLSTPGTSVLFLGDLEAEGGKQLLAGKFADRLPSEYVQMAHHGNWGVERDVYAAIKATYALWTTPPFLWDMPFGNPRGFTAPEVRRWMQELGVQKNYVMKDGLIRLDLAMEKPAGVP
jgi:L-ascorbate metabolism protein UlaG (beta-lactamase superfamily)